MTRAKPTDPSDWARPANPSGPGGTSLPRQSLGAAHCPERFGRNQQTLDGGARPANPKARAEPAFPGEPGRGPQPRAVQAKPADPRTRRGLRTRKLERNQHSQVNPGAAHSLERSGRNQQTPVEPGRGLPIRTSAQPIPNRRPEPVRGGPGDGSRWEPSLAERVRPASGLWLEGCHFPGHKTQPGRVGVRCAPRSVPRTCVAIPGRKASTGRVRRRKPPRRRGEPAQRPSITRTPALCETTPGRRACVRCVAWVQGVRAVRVDRCRVIPGCPPTHGLPSHRRARVNPRLPPTFVGYAASGRMSEPRTRPSPVVRACA